MEELEGFVRTGTMPALQIIRLPNDHTAGGAADMRTPRAYMADNDVALGRIVAALSRSRFWRDTVIFVVEDDAQSGPDHVDSHRSVLLTILRTTRPASSTGSSTPPTSGHHRRHPRPALALGNSDYFGRPMRGLFARRRPAALRHPHARGRSEEKNPPRGPAAEHSGLHDLFASTPRTTICSTAFYGA